MLGRGSRKHRDLSPEVSLTPFIDMLSMCICFLLATAVWVQIGAMEIKQSHGKESAPPVKNRVELDVRFVSPSDVRLAFKRNGRIIRRATMKAKNNQALAEKLDQKMEGLLAKVVRKPKENDRPLGDFVSAARLIPKKIVSYGEMVTVMDVLRRHKVVNLGVVPVQG